VHAKLLHHFLPGPDYSSFDYTCENFGPEDSWSQPYEAHAADVGDNGDSKSNLCPVQRAVWGARASLTMRLLFCFKGFGVVTLLAEMRAWEARSA